ncbi:3-hydroxyanthranilate 3,4-dioxygenase-like [Amphiura filiformis]|uniref:3-hydroxyanthranilate 3,4-dioxygenase-like n=1 Tax=Amphiura filiformis TaxID=82378 RepID=UPI003B21B87D
MKVKGQAAKQQQLAVFRRMCSFLIDYILAFGGRIRDLVKMTDEVVIYDIDEWLKENSKFFLPPVCNKMMHQKGQMKSFYVGGPNQRKDYHLEEGEELFYMQKGDMCLKVVEHGKHRDVPIKEGEIFLLPACIPHSPQRQADTIGLVLERERALEELDALRYFVEGTTESLYEEWFHVEDLGTQLAPVIKRYFASEQHKTGKPIPGTIPEDPPITVDTKETLMQPFCFKDWMEKHSEEIDSKGSKKVFEGNFQFSITMHGAGDEVGGCEAAESWLWQLEGKSEVTVGNEKVKKFELPKNSIMLIPQDTKYTAKREKGSRCLVCYQDPRKKISQEDRKKAAAAEAKKE